VAFICIQKCAGDRSSANHAIDIAAYSDIASHYALKGGAQVATNKALALNSQKEMKAFATSINDTVAKMFKKFKSVSAVTYTTNNFFKGGDTILTAGNIPCDFDPYPVRESDSTYTFKGTVAKKYFSVDSIFVPNKITTIFGRKKTGFMKYDYVVDINNSNPLMTTTNIKAYQYDPKKKWHETRWANMLFGAAIQSGLIYIYKIR